MNEVSYNKNNRLHTNNVKGLKSVSTIHFVRESGDLNVYRKELEWLIAEQQKATELVMEREEELYRLHESHLAEIAAEQNHLDQLKAEHEAEWNTAWQEIDHQRQRLLEEQQTMGLYQLFGT